MRIEATPLAGLYVIHPEPRGDHRGFFARMFCRKIWEEHGLNPHIEQCNLSLTKLKGTVRGLHFQRAPHAEVKLVRSSRGRIFDVAVDNRPDSPTYKQWYGVELSADDHMMFYIPEGFAHGFQALEDDSEIFYQVSAPYNQEAEGGLRYNDPALNITWPIPITETSEKDSAWPLLS